MAKVPTFAKAFAGRWRIVEMDKSLYRPLGKPFSSTLMGMAFLPDGSILVTERPGCLRIIRNGVLDPKHLAGLPGRPRGEVRAPRLTGRRAGGSGAVGRDRRAVCLSERHVKPHLVIGDVAAGQWVDPFDEEIHPRRQPVAITSLTGKPSRA